MELAAFNRDLPSTNSINMPTVPVSLADMVPLLLHASQTNRGWVGDFADDIVQVSRDLYEVLVAYQELVSDKAA